MQYGNSIRAYRLVCGTAQTTSLFNLESLTAKFLQIADPREFLVFQMAMQWKRLSGVGHSPLTAVL